MITFVKLLHKCVCISSKTQSKLYRAVTLLENSVLNFDRKTGFRNLYMLLPNPLQQMME